MFDDNVIGGLPLCPGFCSEMDWKLLNKFVGPLLAKWREIHRHHNYPDIAEMLCPQPIRYVGSAVIILASLVSEFFLLYLTLQARWPWPPRHKAWIIFLSLLSVIVVLVAAGQIISQVRRRREIREQARRFFCWVDALMQALEVNEINELLAMSWDLMAIRASDRLMDLTLAYVSETDPGKAGVIHMDLEYTYNVLCCWGFIFTDWGLQELIDRVKKPLEVVVITPAEMSQITREPRSPLADSAK
jgi:hypothetical protein